MPSLLERAKNLSNRVAELGRVDVEQGNYERLKTRADQIHKYAVAAKATTASVTRMRAKNISIEGLPSASKELRRQPVTLREALKLDLQTVADDNLLATRFLAPLQSFIENVRGKAQSTWRDYVDSIVPKINDSSLEMLNKAGFGTQVSKFRQLRDEVRVLRESLPASDDVFTRLKGLADEIELIWSELRGVPPAVMNFLNKATQRNATFADLTPEVSEWLKNKGLMAQLRIGLG